MRDLPQPTQPAVDLSRGDRDPRAFRRFWFGYAAVLALAAYGICRWFA